jgi:mRNA interferase RelE/StbE
MYKVEVKKKAEKEIQALPKKDQQRVLAALEVLEENPFVGKKLEGPYEGAWSFRVWLYRILYTIRKDIVTVTVLRVGHRKNVYR